MQRAIPQTLAILLMALGLIVLPGCTESPDSDAPDTPAVSPDGEGDDAGDMMDKAGDAVNDMVDEGKEAMDDMVDEGAKALDEGKKAVDDMVDEGSKAMDDVAEGAEDMADDLEEAADETMEDGKKVIDDMKKEANDAMDSMKKSMEGAMKQPEQKSDTTAAAATEDAKAMLATASADAKAEATAKSVETAKVAETAEAMVAYDGSVYAEAPMAKDFTLTSVLGKEHSLADFKGKFVVLEWVNHGCPFVVKHYDSGNIPSLQKKYTDKGVIWLSICSSANGKQGFHTAEEWKPLLEKKKSAATATLLDVDGTVGKLYGAKTTPHIYIIDPNQKLIYQGAIDSIASADKADIAKAVNYVTATLDALMNNETVEKRTTQPYGCGVKY